MNIFQRMLFIKSKLKIHYLIQIKKWAPNDFKEHEWVTIICPKDLVMKIKEFEDAKKH